MSAMNNQGVGSEGKPIYLDQHGAAKATTPATSSSSVDTTNFNDDKLVTKGYVDKNMIIVTPTASYSAGTKIGNITVKDGANSEKANKDIFVPNATAAQKGAIKTVMGADAVGTDANGDLKAVTVSKGGGSYAGDDDKLASKGYVDKVRPVAGRLLEYDSTDGKLKVQVAEELKDTGAYGVKNADFLGINNGKLVAAKAPSVSIPGLDPNDLSNVINFGTMNSFTYPTVNDPGTIEDGMYVKTLRSINELTIQLKYKYITRPSLRYWHYFNLPTWNDGSTRFLYLTICFNATTTHYVWMEADDGSKFHIDVAHGFKSSSGNSSADRTVINISLPIKSGVRIVCSPESRDSWYVENLSNVVKLAHAAGFLIC